ncbi:MAG: CoA transferase [Syntrophales bacterium LBB04]|nr:CoA transferase [Syntrophales bacterium LBB04]
MPPIRGESRAFWVLNRNKRSLSLDLRQPEGQAVLQRLAKSADVLMHNYRPGVDERLGIAYPLLHSLNPRLIYVALSPYGAKGRFSLARGYDLLSAVRKERCGCAKMTRIPRLRMCTINCCICAGVGFLPSRSTESCFKP